MSHSICHVTNESTDFEKNPNTSFFYYFADSNCTRKLVKVLLKYLYPQVPAENYLHFCHVHHNNFQYLFLFLLFHLLLNLK